MTWENSGSHEGLSGGLSPRERVLKALYLRLTVHQLPSWSPQARGEAPSGSAPARLELMALVWAAGTVLLAGAHGSGLQRLLRI